MGPFFSRQSVLKLEWLIKESVEKLCARLQEVKATNQPMDMALLYRSLTSDIVSEYAFSQSYGFLDNLENSKNFFESFQPAWTIFWILREVPVVSQILLQMNNIPRWLKNLLPQNEPTKALDAWDTVRESPMSHAKHLRFPKQTCSAFL